MSKLKSDNYRKARGGWSRCLKISCKECSSHLFNYQKDGTGALKRLYLDRIIEYKPNFDSQGFVYCECGACVGFNEPYRKENNRPAIRLASESITYKIVPA